MFFLLTPFACPCPDQLLVQLPHTTFLLGCFVYPKVACCPKLGDLVGDDSKFGAPETEVTDGELDDVNLEEIERE